MKTATFAVSAVLAGGGACAPAPEPDVVETRSQELRVEPVRAEIIGGETVQRTIIWPSAPHRTRDELPASTRKDIDRAPVPVLVPEGRAWLTDLNVSTSSAYAQVWGRADGISFNVIGSSQARLFRGTRVETGDLRLRDGDGQVEQVEGIWTAGFLENGAAYAVELECEEPRDERCSEAGVVDFTQGLVFVGGVGLRGAP